jgi:hypothetical protein
MRPGSATDMVRQSRAESEHPFDAIDLGFGIIAAAIAPITPALVVVAVLQYFARRSTAVARAILSAMNVESDDLVLHSRATAALLPGVKGLLDQNDDAAERPELGTRRIGAGSIVADVPDDDPFGEPPASAPASKPDARRALKRLPKLVRIATMKPYPKSPTAIPLGIDANGEHQWIDLQYNTLHVGLYGTSGSGKDSLLRAWFLYLCKANAPEMVQFAILDGKGDWLIASLASLAHMFMAPAGGYGKAGDEQISQAVQAIDQEAQRRQQLITSAGCRTREEYVAKTGQPMPLLVVVATDVMTSIAGEVESLLETLVSKARSLGIRVVVSMQTPTGRSTRWRMNLSTVIAGFLQAGSQDEPALGIPIKEMEYRPSQLPDPKTQAGVFVVRQGNHQHLVQAPYIDEPTFDRLCETLPAKAQRSITQAPEDGLLSSLLASSSDNEPPADMVTIGNAGNEGVTASESDVTTAVTVTVTTAEAAKIAMLLASLPPSEVVKKLDGYSPRKYAEYKAKVEYIAAILGK